MTPSSGEVTRAEMVAIDFRLASGVLYQGKIENARELRVFPRCAWNLFNSRLTESCSTENLSTLLIHSIFTPSYASRLRVSVHSMPNSVTRSEENYLQTPHPRGELHLERKGQLISFFLKFVHKLPQILMATFQLWMLIKTKEESERQEGQPSSFCFTPVRHEEGRPAPFDTAYRP